ncbi:MAG TPA: GNAT family N-acetyltransferase [Pseudolabrys sp.]|nr:GNAT family N-acetyltransferase [Pseudolabrys sp.]
MSVTIRPARPADAGLIYALVCELADYERLTHDVDSTEQQIASALFGPQPRVFCYLAEWNGEAVGFALWFLNFSTFRGRHGLYLEDIFVRPAMRGKGIGKALMQQLARHCVERGYARFEWTVLDWNEPSIEFYRSIGADVLNDWRVCRMSGEALTKFARQEAR